nr:FHA domain-containing protein [Nakamurella aerolata]
MSRANPFPPLSVPQFAPPPFVPIATTLPPAGPQNAQNTPDLSKTPAPQPEGDHDGHTQVGFSQLASDLAAGTAGNGSDPGAGNPDITDSYDAVELGPGEVYAVVCASRHANPPLSTSCRVCGAAIANTRPEPVERPVLADLALSTGQRVAVQAPVVIGRAPAALGNGAQLVTVPSPHQDISRSHVEVRAEDWHVVVADLKSTNGTVVRAPDRPDQLLHPGQAIVVEPGWEIDLGDGVTVQVREPGDQRDMR